MRMALLVTHLLNIPSSLKYIWIPNFLVQMHLQIKKKEIDLKDSEIDKSLMQRTSYANHNLNN